MMISAQPRTSQIAAESDLSTVGVVIPTLNAASGWNTLQRALDQQGLAPEQILIVDSSSDDKTRQLARAAGYTVFNIPRGDFRHGATRQLATWHLPWANLLLYMTQDAIPASKLAFVRLLAAFDDPGVGAAYGRQLPREGADPIERHARLFNYPAASHVRTLESRREMGIKAAFLSNSFAAYRRSALEAVGGFPIHVIMAEDSLVAARMLLAGWQIAYCAEATVVHSHPHSLRVEFCRYFDTGVHHARESWLRYEFGEAGGEGIRYLRSEMRYLLSTDAGRIPKAALRTASKLCAYRLGLIEEYLPLSLKRSLSAHPEFWKRELAQRTPEDRSSH